MGLQVPGVVVFCGFFVSLFLLVLSACGFFVAGDFVSSFWGQPPPLPWDLSFLTKDRTWALNTENTEF